MKPPIPDPKIPSRLPAKEERPSVALNICAFLACLGLGGWGFWHLGDIWFYALHGQKTLKFWAVTMVLLYGFLLLITSGRTRRRPTEFVLSSLFGLLLAFEAVITYALFIWMQGRHG